MVIPWSPSLYFLGFSKFTHFSRQRVFIIFTLLHSLFLTLFHLCCWIFFMLEEEEWAELHTTWDVESFIHWPIVLPMFLSLLFSMIPYILFFFLSLRAELMVFREWLYSIYNDSKISFMNGKSIFRLLFSYLLCFTNINTESHLPFCHPIVCEFLQQFQCQLFLQLLSTIICQKALPFWSSHLF